MTSDEPDIQGIADEIADRLTEELDLPDGYRVVFEMQPVLGRCQHGVDLDREFCPDGCRA